MSLASERSLLLTRPPRVLEEEGRDSTQEWIAVGILSICSLTNNIFMEACTLPNGHYPFKWMNLMAISFTFAGIISFALAENIYKHITPKFLAFQFLAAAGALIPSYILNPVGLSETSVQVAAAMSFATHPLSALFFTIQNRKFPGKILSIVIISAAIQILAFAVYTAGKTNISLYGITLLILASVIQALTNVVNHKFVGQDFQHIDAWTQTFWYCIASVFMAFLLLPPEALFFYDGFTWCDFIPGHHFDTKSIAIAVFLAIYNISWVQVSVFNARIFISSYFTGIVFSSLLASGQLAYATDRNTKRKRILSLLGGLDELESGHMFDSDIPEETTSSTQSDAQFHIILSACN